MPRPPRFFITLDQVIDEHITLFGEDVRHIATVLRMKTGDELVLCDGEGTEYSATITQVSKSEITAEVKARSKREIRFPRVTLCQGIPKSDKMDWIVQKATELGVAAIIPLVTERTVVKIRDEEKRVTRWQKIAREAAMQSNRPDIPTVGAVIPYRDLFQTLNPEPRTLLLLPWEEGTLPIRDIVRANTGCRNVIVLIGPEGGYSSQEAGTAREKGFHLVSLGPTILRTETAAVAVLSMLLYEFL
jgi:16S rRNA (uracil1498-N3)-methyltransferase